MEYRHDSARARYLVRPRDAQTLLPLSAADGMWYDYDGDAAYGDYTLAYDGQAHTLTPTHQLAVELGLGQFAPTTGSADYFHGNLIGTTHAMTDDSMFMSYRAVYTAFGELVCAGPNLSNCGTAAPAAETRHGYAGAWGYRRSSWDGSPGACGAGTPSLACDPLAELGWLHVGHRYYDPGSGRFMQRDPIGISCGPNVYVYVVNNPLLYADPLGLWTPFDNEWVARATLWITGGNSAAGRFIDKVGGQIDRDRSDTRLTARPLIACSNATVRKKLQAPGQTPRTSIWTKATNNLKWGRRLMKASGYLTILEGTFATGDIGRGVIAWWYDVELD